MAVYYLSFGVSAHFDPSNNAITTNSDLGTNLIAIVSDVLKSGWVVSLKEDYFKEITREGERKQTYFEILRKQLEVEDKGEIWKVVHKLSTAIKQSTYMNLVGITSSNYLVEPITDLGFAKEYQDPTLVEKLFPKIAKFKKFVVVEHKNDWAINQVCVDRVKRNKKGFSGKGIRVGLIDTGYTDHQEIGKVEGNFEPSLGFNTFDNNTDVEDPLRKPLKIEKQLRLPGHGTGTGSVLNSKQQPKWNVDVIGVAPDAKVIPFRIGDSAILSSTKLRLSAALAVEHASNSPAECDVISLSIGYPVGDIGLRKLIDSATNNGKIVVAAAGQVPPFLRAQWWPMAMPASYFNTIAVTASNIDECLCQWAFKGKWVDCAAPGENVWKAHWDIPRFRLRNFPKPKQSTKPGTGTSYAVPHVSGIAALWLEKWKSQLSKVQQNWRTYLFRYVLKNCGIVPINRTWDWGIIDACKVLDFDWPADPQWKAFCRNSENEYQPTYTYREEFAMVLPGHSLMLHYTHLIDYVSASIEAAVDIFNLNDEAELEDILEDQYAEIIFNLTIKENYLSRLLFDIANRLNLSRDQFIPMGEKLDRSPTKDEFLKNLLR